MTDHIPLAGGSNDDGIFVICGLFVHSLGIPTMQYANDQTLFPGSRRLIGVNISNDGKMNSTYRMETVRDPGDHKRRRTRQGRGHSAP